MKVIVVSRGGASEKSARATVACKERMASADPRNAKSRRRRMETAKPPTANPYKTQSHHGADGTLNVAPGSSNAWATRIIKPRSKVLAMRAAPLPRTDGRTIVANPKGVTAVATRAAGTFRSGEIGDIRWNDSTMNTTNTVS